MLGLQASETSELPKPAMQAIERRDLFLIEAIVFTIALTTMIINLVVDLIYAYLDPKIRYS